MLADTHSHTSNTSNVVQHFDHVLHYLSLPLCLRSTFHKLLKHGGKSEQHGMMEAIVI